MVEVAGRDAACSPGWKALINNRVSRWGEGNGGTEGTSIFSSIVPEARLRLRLITLRAVLRSPWTFLFWAMAM